MATSERLQIQKLKNSEPGQQKFALILFEDEERYSVIEVGQIKESHYAYHQVVNVWWGRGKEAKYFPAKLLKCGTKEDCEKAALELSFLQDTSDKESDDEDPYLTPKRKRCNETFQPKKRKETDESADALWKASIEEEKRKLDSVLKVSHTKDHSQRSHSPSHLVTPEVKPHRELSTILLRLDKIDSKLDILLRASSLQPLPPTPTSRSETPSPAIVKEVTFFFVQPKY